jgi:2-polyprenyl-3-methyl-5-hydroxy-6-metoxy-1,4-benzoquinol methylase
MMVREKEIEFMNTIRTATLERCPVCDSAKIAQRLDPPADDTRFSQFALFVCGDCEAAFVNPRPLEEEISKLYVARDYGMDLATKSGLSYWLKSTKLRLYYRKVLRHAGAAGLSVLDYGCGDALLALTIARMEGRNGRIARVVAADFATEAPADLRTAQAPESAPVEYVHLPDLFTARFENAFDVIVLRHVLEHTPDARATVRRLAPLVKRGGTLVIEIPNFDSPWRRLFGSHYCQLGIPQHLMHYNRRSFRRALQPLEQEKLIELIELRSANIPVLGSSLGHVFFKRYDNIGPIAAAFYPMQLGVDLIARQSAAMMAYLRVC